MVLWCNFRLALLNSNETGLGHGRRVMYAHQCHLILLRPDGGKTDFYLTDLLQISQTINDKQKGMTIL